MTSLIYPDILLSGSGVAFPNPTSVVTNEEIYPLIHGRVHAAIGGLSSDHALLEEIAAVREKHGFHHRYWANQRLLGRKVDGVSSEDLMAEATYGAILDAGLELEDIDMIICCSTTTSRISPVGARFVSEKLGLSCSGFDLKNGCSSTLYALSVAASLLQSGLHRHIVVTAAETFSNWIGEGNPKVYAAGDGGAAVVLSKDGSGNGTKGVQYCELGAESVFLEETGIGGALPPRLDDFTGAGYLLQMTGEVYPLIIRKWEQLSADFSEKSGVKRGQIDWIFSNQVNQGTRQMIASLFGCELERTIDCVPEVANCGSPGPLIAFHQARRSGVISEGELGLFCAVGTGLAWGALLFKL